MANHGMLFVQGKDRPGIIKAVTGILFSSGANLEDISMTLLDGQFAMMLSFAAGPAKWKKLADKTHALKIKPWNLNVDLISIAGDAGQKNNSVRSVLITAIGKDRTGIVYQLSSGLAKISANITNLDCRLLRQAKNNNLYSLALAVDFKKSSDLKKIQSLIRGWESKLGIEVKLHSSESAVF